MYLVLIMDVTRIYTERPLSQPFRSIDAGRSTYFQRGGLVLLNLHHVYDA